MLESYLTVRRVTPELHFDVSANSKVDCGAIHNAAAKLWVSFWFKLDSIFSIANPTDLHLWGKKADATNYITAWLESSNGVLRFQMLTGGAADFTINSAETSWAADTWYHAITSTSDVAKVRMVVNGGTAVTDADGTAVTNGGNFMLGYAAVVAGTLTGEMRDVAIGTDDLSATEERDLLKGIIPADATDFWRLNEGHGRSVISLGTDGTTGTIDTAPRWETGLRGYVRY